jgi:hypothetical protein
MRTFIAIALSTTLLASTAFAADVGPLATGKPAGVKQAQDMNIGTTGWVLLGVGVATAIGIGVASSSNGSPLNGPQNIAVTTTTI